MLYILTVRYFDDESETAILHARIIGSKKHFILDSLKRYEEEHYVVGYEVQTIEPEELEDGFLVALYKTEEMV
jgi:hypothetical protein